MIFTLTEDDARWYEKWHRWFAWRPVRLDARRVAWMCWVERKDGGLLSDTIVWEYRLPK